MITFWILGFSIAFILRCVFAKPYKDDEERFKDKWNWTGFGGGYGVFVSEFYLYVKMGRNS